MTKQTQKPARPYGGVDTAQRQKERREKFIAAGLETFGTKGYAKSTIKGICELAGLTERYFYESFQKKEDLLIAVYRRLITDLETDIKTIIEAADTPPMDKAYNAAKLFFQRFSDDPRRARVQLYEILGVSTRVDKEYLAATQTLTGWIEVIAAAVFPDIDRDRMKNSVIPTGLAGALIYIANQWVMNGFKTPVNDISTQYIGMFSQLDKTIKEAR